MVRSIDNIINKKYLLTLPQNFIYNLLKYLSINDIKNFCLLSRAAYQVFFFLIKAKISNIEFPVIVIFK